MAVPPTNMPIDAKFLVLAQRAAEAEGLDAALVCAVVEQESGWNPWAMRYEPAFFAKYVAPSYTNNKVGATEAYARGDFLGIDAGDGSNGAGKRREFPLPFDVVRSGGGIGGRVQNPATETGRCGRRCGTGDGRQWR